MVRSGAGRRWRSADDLRSDARRADGWSRADHASGPSALRPARVALERQSARNVLVNQCRFEMRARRVLHDRNGGRTQALSGLLGENFRGDLAAAREANVCLGVAARLSVRNSIADAKSTGQERRFGKALGCNKAHGAWVFDSPTTVGSCPEVGSPPSGAGTLLESRPSSALFSSPMSGKASLLIHPFSPACFAAPSVSSASTSVDPAARISSASFFTAAERGVLTLTSRM